MYKKFLSKISRDLLVALIISYFLLLIPELILPGIVSAHFDPKYVLIFIFLLGIIFSKLETGQKKPENTKFQTISRNLINAILFIITAMLVLSLYKMKIWEIVCVVVISIPLLISAENILVKEK
jgi:hypothetical protein